VGATTASGTASASAIVAGAAAGIVVGSEGSVTEKERGGTTRGRAEAAAATPTPTLTPPSEICERGTGSEAVAAETTAEAEVGTGRGTATIGVGAPLRTAIGLGTTVAAALWGGPGGGPQIGSTTSRVTRPRADVAEAGSPAITGGETGTTRTSARRAKTKKRRLPFWSRCFHAGPTIDL
jgi:hypothetical protein